MHRWALLLALAFAACDRDGAGERARDDAPDDAPAAELAPACGGARLRVRPEDLGARGPFAAGLRSVLFDGIIADVYYPAPPGSDAGRPPAVHELVEHLPPAEAARVAPSSSDLPVVRCACTRNLPLDEDHGPYPVVIFFHGRGLTRAQFPTLAAHLASRGFVVIAPDQPGADLAGQLTGEPVPERAERLALLLDAARFPTGDLDFLAGHVDGWLGLVGHSLGAGTVARLLEPELPPRHSSEAVVVAVIAGAAGLKPRRALPVTIIGGTGDAFTPIAVQREGYAATPAPRRFVGVAGAGHMHFADHCTAADHAGGWYGAAAARGVRFTGFPRVLAERGCSDGGGVPEWTQRTIVAVITGALEEVLFCDPGAGAALEGLGGTAQVSELRQERR